MKARKMTHFNAPSIFLTFMFIITMICYVITDNWVFLLMQMEFLIIFFMNMSHDLLSSVNFKLNLIFDLLIVIARQKLKKSKKKKK